MLAVTPAGCSVEDRKPRVISEVRKTHVQRSPSLEGHPRISGILYHYLESESAWRPRWAAVRNGCLVAQPPDRLAGGCATLGRIPVPRRLADIPPARPSRRNNSREHDIKKINQPNDGFVAPITPVRRFSEFQNKCKTSKGIDVVDGTCEVSAGRIACPVPRCVSEDRLSTPLLTEHKFKSNGYAEDSSDSLTGSLTLDYAAWRVTDFNANGFETPRSRCGGGECLRLSLRHLNLRPCGERPNAFTLSRRDGTESIAVATFQAASRRDYERWVKTLAVEILRQTPLDAVRFIDVIGIAAFDEPPTPRSSRACHSLPSDLCRESPAPPASSAPPVPAPRGRARIKQQAPPPPTSDDPKEYLRTPIEEVLGKKDSDEEARNYTSITSNEISKRISNSEENKLRIEIKNSPSPLRRYFRKSRAHRNIFASESKREYTHEPFSLPMSKNELLSEGIVNLHLGRNGDKSDDSTHSSLSSKTSLLMVDTTNISNESQALDEGIVVEDDDYDSSSENSFGKAERKARRESENSNCLDSPKSITSHSSCGDSHVISKQSGIKNMDEIAAKILQNYDAIDGIITKKTMLNSLPALDLQKSKDCNYNNASFTEKDTNIEVKTKENQTNPYELIINQYQYSIPTNKDQETCKSSDSIKVDLNHGCSAPFAYNLRPAGICELVAKDSVQKERDLLFNSATADISSGLTSSNHFIKSDPAKRELGRWSWEATNSEKESALLDSRRLYTRARSVSPGKSCIGVQRRVASCTRSGKMSIDEEPNEGIENVVALKIRCQDTEHYVPVREKLALFETLSQMGPRLARSSEDLVVRKLISNEDKDLNNSKRACSLHDLSIEPKSTTVPVKEICKFFETIGRGQKVTNVKCVNSDEQKTIKCFIKWHVGGNNASSPKIESKKSNRVTTKTKLIPYTEGDRFSSSKNNFVTNTKLNSFENMHYLSYRPIHEGNKIISFV